MNLNAELSTSSIFDKNLLTFDYSFGYDCLRLYNLTAATDKVVVHATGRFLHFHDVSTGAKAYRTGTTSGGIGQICMHPSLPHLAVGEKGTDPPVVIYRWPQITILKNLQGGAKKGYSCLRYNEEGTLLASQASAPDFLITLWKWEEGQILLQTKSFDVDVYSVIYSAFNYDQLSSCGVAHFKTWKMSETFTGLKLKGELGRFGKTETCDLISTLPLPDGSCATGSSWGNILLWSEGVVRLEVTRVGRNPCHKGAITKVDFYKQALMTAGMDGAIRMWNYETIEMADPSEEDPVVEMEPLFTFMVSLPYAVAQILSLTKSSSDPSDDQWFVQDCAGGVWTVHLSLGQTFSAPKRIFCCHAGPVTGLSAHPANSIIATIGSDRRLMVFDYSKKSLLTYMDGSFPGTCLLWLPLTLTTSGSYLIAGYESGVLRLFTLMSSGLKLVQAIKPHTKAVINVIVFNNLLISASKDATIFIFGLHNAAKLISFNPKGFCRLPSPATALAYASNNVIFVGCENGEVCKITIPAQIVLKKSTTYLLELEIDVLDCVELIKTYSRKSAEEEVEKETVIEEENREDQDEGFKDEGEEDIEQEEPAVKDEEPMEEVKEAEEEKKEEEAVEVNKEEEEPQTAEPEAKPKEEEIVVQAGEENLEEVDEEDDESKVKLPVLEFGAILFLFVLPSGHLILSSDKDYKGVLFVINFEKQLVVSKIEDIVSPTTEIRCCLYWAESKCLFFGLGDGKVMALPVSAKGVTQDDQWSCGLHDVDHGAINRLAMSWDSHTLISCGNDGGIFSCLLHGTQKQPETYKPYISDSERYSISEDLDDVNSPSLEEIKMKENMDNFARQAGINRQGVIHEVANLRKQFVELVNANEELPVELRLTREELIPDMRVVKDLEKFLDEEMKLVYRKLARDSERSKLLLNKVRGYFLDQVEVYRTQISAIQAPHVVETFRQRRLPEEFRLNVAKVDEKLAELKARGSTRGSSAPPEIPPPPKPEHPDPVEALIKQVALFGDVTRNRKLMNLIQQRRARRALQASRNIEWDEHMSRQPDPTRADPADIAALEFAMQTVGDFKLKSSPDFKVPKHLIVNTISKYKELLDARQKIYDSIADFNNRVLHMRDRKQDILTRHKKLRTIIKQINLEIPPSRHTEPPALPVIREEVEYPEREYELTEEDVQKCLPVHLRPKLSRKESLDSAKVDHDPEYMVQFCGKPNNAGPMGETDWEIEMRKWRVEQKTQEKNEIIAMMQQEITEFDREIKNLCNEKVIMELENKYLEHHILVLHKEVLVLKIFENEENTKLEAALAILKEKKSLQDNIHKATLEMEENVKEITRIEGDIKVLVAYFLNEITDNKFYDFLRKIFRKKYKPPKTKTDDSDESESSDDESDSDEDEDKSIDSKDFNLSKMDESICPEGCDKELYNMTFEKRSERHALELAINLKRRNIELLKKKFDGLNKQILMVDVNYEKAQKEVEKVQAEKQAKMNTIQTIVFLKLSQIQNFRNDRDLATIEDSLVMSHIVMNQLGKRISELNADTQETINKHEQNKQHLNRLIVDIRYMNDLIERLEEEVKNTMYRKFGSIINLDEVEEMLAKKLVSEMTFIAFELQQKLEKKFVTFKDELKAENDYYISRLAENTKRNNILTILKEENIKLDAEIHRQVTAKISLEKTPVKDDLKPLEMAVVAKEEEVARIRYEIACLKGLVKPVPPVGTFGVPHEPFEMAEFKGIDGKMYEVKYAVRDLILDLSNEIEELLVDIRSDMGRGKALRSLRTLVEKFMDLIPEAALKEMWEKLSEGRSAAIDVMLQDIPTLLTAAEMILDISLTFSPPRPHIFGEVEEKIEKEIVKSEQVEHEDTDASAIDTDRD